MGERPRIFVASILALVVVSTVGMAACTREKPAPTPNPDWVPPKTTSVSATAVLPTAAATVISVEPTPGGPESVSTSVAVPESTPLVSTPDLAEVVPTPEIPTPAPEGATFTYVVRSGETLYSIARRFGTTVQELVLQNDLASADALQVGQKLVIPGSSPPSVEPETPAPVVHVVQRGETLQAIALRYGVTQGAIMSANELANPNRIYVGQQLTIPGGAAPAESQPRTHVVQRGETLSQIARRYGVTLQAVQNANGITDPDTISVGQRLTIP